MSKTNTPRSSSPAASINRREALLGGTAIGIAQSARMLVGPSVLAGLLGEAHAADAPKPNIIYIIADDLGWSDAGFRGSDIKTPNLDSLAKDGATLEQFYTQPMCTPTRAAMLTGRYPLRYGLQTGVIPGAGTYGLATDEYLLPQALKDAGYATALVGKWHLGHAKPELWPKQRGFDYFYGTLVGEIDHFKHSSHGVPDWYRDNAPIEEEGFDNLLFGNEAERVVRDHDTSKPLFLYLAFTAPHTPFQAPQEYVDRYTDIADENRRIYAAMVSVMDEAIGKVTAALKERGMSENTLIVFHSDNGGVKDTLFAGDTKVSGGLPANNGPYRSAKGTRYEGGTRVIALANWPGKIKPGPLNEPLHVVDMYPTLAGIAGASTSKTKPLDGMDVWSTLAAGQASPRQEIVYNVDPTSAGIRQGDWKLVWKAALPQHQELFNIAADPYEKNNLLSEHPDKVAHLSGRAEELAKEMVPPLLLMEAVKLTFYTPPVSGDPSVLFSGGD